MKYFTSILLFTTLLLSSCGSGEQSEDTANKKEETTETDTPGKNENTEDVLMGKAKIAIGDDTFVIEDFRKNKTELTYTNSGVTLRLTNASNERFILISLEGKEVLDARPLKINVEQGSKSGANTARVTMMGFFDPEDTKDQFILKNGELTINELDEESLDVNITFKGDGGKVMDFKNENSVSIEGLIDISLDNKMDARKK
jgi:hypothetical protein